jgi:pyruvate-ferredoxin/flavodoxin oxidoreductase
VDKTYGKKSKRLADLNYGAIDKTLENLHQVELSVGAVTPGEGRGPGDPHR